MLSVRLAAAALAVAVALALPGAAAAQSIRVDPIHIAHADTGGETPTAPDAGQPISDAQAEALSWADDVGGPFDTAMCLASLASPGSVDVQLVLPAGAVVNDPAADAPGPCGPEETAPGEPISAHVKGSSSWGRVIFESNGYEFRIESFYLADTDCDSHPVYVEIHASWGDDSDKGHRSSHAGCGKTIKLGDVEFAGRGDSEYVWLRACVDIQWAPDRCAAGEKVKNPYYLV